MSRACGGCTLCCTALAVPELNKPNGVPCVHLTPEGCGIYEDRPESCRVFQCAWLQGAGPRDTRPDRTGGVITCEDDTSPHKLGVAVVVYSDPNGKDPEENEYVLGVLRRAITMAPGTAILVRGDQPRKLLTHPASEYARKVAKLQAEGVLP